MHLRDYLIQNDLQESSPEDIRAGLDETVELSRNSTRQTIADVAKTLGFTSTIALSDRLKANGFELFLSVVTAGCRFDDPETIEGIDAAVAAEAMTADEAIALKELGIKYGKRWVKVGLNALPSLDDISTEQATIASNELGEQVALRYQAVRDAMAAGEILTWDAARAAMGAE